MSKLFREMAQGLAPDPEKVWSLFAEVGESAPPFWSRSTAAGESVGKDKALGIAETFDHGPA